MDYKWQVAKEVDEKVLYVIGILLTIYHELIEFNYFNIFFYFYDLLKKRLKRLNLTSLEIAQYFPIV